MSMKQGFKNEIKSMIDKIDDWFLLNQIRRFIFNITRVG